MALSYYEQLKHQNWLNKRHQIMERDGFCCTICGTNLHKLEVHHLCYFSDLLIWEYDDELMITVCGKHHEQLHELHKITGLIAFHCLKENIDLNTICDILLKIKDIQHGTR